MERKFNLTQHTPTPEQLMDGVFTSVTDERKVRELLTFDGIPSVDDINRRASELADIAKSHDVSCAMIGGAPFLMGALEIALRARGIRPVYAFSRREAVESMGEDGVVNKTMWNHHGHLGVVNAPKV